MRRTVVTCAAIGGRALAYHLFENRTFEMDSHAHYFEVGARHYGAAHTILYLK